ncbi:small acid-soluble spore protein Tlp [Paenibacillus abyssi]|nr:small acid-soluble spore protein Tlp [Paenibacillus abyssi]
MAKPDNRADNAEKLRDAVQNTVRNIDEAEEYLAEHASEIAPDQKEIIENKNNRRRQSIEGMRSEIKDEVNNEQ